MDKEKEENKLTGKIQAKSWLFEVSYAQKLLEDFTRGPMQ